MILSSHAICLCFFVKKMGKSPLDYAAEPNELLLEEAKAKIEQQLKVKSISPTPAAEEGKPETSEEKTLDQLDKAEDDSEQARTEFEASAPSAEAKGNWLDHFMALVLNK